MKILILGGTGAMGTGLVKQLCCSDNDIYIISRWYHDNHDNISYIQGNAKEDDFLDSILSGDYDVIVDFMTYSTSEFKRRIGQLLLSAKQYIFISSARVYSQCDTRITEKTPRLLDTIDDEEYLKTDEYALAKARQENLLFQSGKQNYTIIRPSITYNSYRLQLGVWEKEHWLYRALHGRTIVFSNDIGEKLTAMTHGQDVALGIASLIGEKRAMGECYHIVNPNSLKWNDILGIYLDVLEELTGKRPKVLMTDKSTCFKVDWNKYQVLYCRYFNRTFDCRKINSIVDVSQFKNIRDGIKESLEQFLDNPRFSAVNWKLEALHDRICGERTSLSEIKGIKTKIKYLCYRYHLEFLLDMFSILKRILTNR